jgi:hypothetical protein
LKFLSCSRSNTVKRDDFGDTAPQHRGRPLGTRPCARPRGHGSPSRPGPSPCRSRVPRPPRIPRLHASPSTILGARAMLRVDRASTLRLSPAVPPPAEPRTRPTVVGASVLFASCFEAKHEYPAHCSPPIKGCCCSSSRAWTPCRPPVEPPVPGSRLHASPPPHEPT